MQPYSLRWFLLIFFLLPFPLKAGILDHCLIGFQLMTSKRLVAVNVQYSENDFTKSQFLPFDQKVTDESHARFARGQAALANQVAKYAHNRIGTAKRRFHSFYGDRLLQKPFAAEAATPLLGPQNQAFRDLLAHRKFASYHSSSGEGSDVAQKFGLSAQERQGLSSRLLNISYAHRNDDGTDVAAVRMNFVTTLDARRLIGTVISKNTKEVYFWSHMGHPFDQIALRDCFQRIDRLPEIRRTQGDRAATESFAHATFMFYNAMPSMRHSAAMGNSWLAGEYGGALGRTLPFVDGLDRYAMTLSQDEFVQFYVDRIVSLSPYPSSEAGR